jgi:hypothetical protein
LSDSFHGSHLLVVKQLRASEVCAPILDLGKRAEP